MSEMKLSDIFSVSYGNKFDLNKMSPLPKKRGGINFVGRSSENHGVSATIQEVNGIAPFPAGMITVALGGTKLLSSFVQEQPFYTAQNVAVLVPKVTLSLPEKIFICLAIRHNRFRYSAFGREANRTIRQLKIPARGSFPPWLSEAEESVRGSLLSKLVPLEKDSTARIGADKIGSETIKISDLFEVTYGSNLELNSLTETPDGINFVSRTAKNNGVSARVKPVKDLAPIEGPVLSVAGGGRF
jgi:hypothetical protein